MLADDNCIPMYSSDLKDFNNYDNYTLGKIKFPTKDCYENLNYAFKNGYSKSTDLSFDNVMFERLGVNSEVKEAANTTGSIGLVFYFYLMLH